MPEEISWYYPNSLCFENKSNVKIKGNWNDNDFLNIDIIIDGIFSYE